MKWNVILYKILCAGLLYSSALLPPDRPLAIGTAAEENGSKFIAGRLYCWWKCGDGIMP